jgi:site-specific recombinase XerD
MRKILANQQNEMAIQQQMEEVKELIKNSISENTKKAYRNDWTQFEDWCFQKNVEFMPAEVDTVLLYVNELHKTYKYSTIRRKLSSIRQAHTIKRVYNPTKDHAIQQIMTGIAKQDGTKQDSKKAVVLGDMKQMIDVIDTEKMIGKRDKAMLLLGFALASRRSELVSIDAEDITFTSQGMDISIQQKKTNDEPIRKSVVRIDSDYCPVQALRDWMDAADIKEGAVLTSMHGNRKERTNDKTVARVVKKYASNPSDH